jgi:hypothetical protein
MSRLKVECPECGCRLLVDAKTGLVIRGESKKPDYSFESALEKVAERKSKADQLFSQAMDDEKRRHSSLEDKFREALRSKDELEDPKRLWDLD